MDNAKYANTHTQFHVAINGVPFFLYPNPEYRLTRGPVSDQKDQIDTSSEPGEQSLTSWWYRSQSSFHLGCGMEFFDVVRRKDTDQYRFDHSLHVDPWTKGEVSLLPEYREIWSGGRSPHSRIASYSTKRTKEDSETGLEGNDGVLVSDKWMLYAVSYNNGEQTQIIIDYGAVPSGLENGEIKDIVVTGANYFVVVQDKDPDSKDAFYIFGGPLPNEVEDGEGVMLYEADVGGRNKARITYNQGFLFLTVGRFWWWLPGAVGYLQEKLKDDDAVDVIELPLDMAEIGENGTPLIYKDEDKDFEFTDLTKTNGPIFASGYKGDPDEIWGLRSYIFSITMDKAKIDDDVHIGNPTIVGEMPIGEYAQTLNQVGDYLLIGSNRGLRVGTVDSYSGEFDLGVLHDQAGDVGHSASYGRFVWFSGKNDGLWRMDLANPISREQRIFPVVKEYESKKWGTGEQTKVGGIAMYGKSGKPAWVLKEWRTEGATVVTYAEDEKRPDGYLQTGQLRFDTWEFKLFQFLRTVWNQKYSGNFSVEWVDDLGNRYPVEDWYGNGAVGQFGGAPGWVDTAASDRAPRISVAWRFNFHNAGGQDPHFKGYQIKGAPSAVKDRWITLPLMCARRERMRQGRTVERSVFDRVKAMEELERSGELVWYQDFGTGEQRAVVVEEVLFVSDVVSQSTQEGEDPMGTLLLKLRTVDTTP